MVLAQTAILTRLSYGTRLQKLYHSSRQTTYQLHFRAAARRLTCQLHSRAVLAKIVPMLWKIMLLMRKLVLMP